MYAYFVNEYIVNFDLELNLECGLGHDWVYCTQLYHCFFNKGQDLSVSLLSVKKLKRMSPVIDTHETVIFASRIVRVSSAYCTYWWPAGLVEWTSTFSCVGLQSCCQLHGLWSTEKKHSAYTGFVGKEEIQSEIMYCIAEFCYES